MLVQIRLWYYNLSNPKSITNNVKYTLYSLKCSKLMYIYIWFVRCIYRHPFNTITLKWRHRIKMINSILLKWCSYFNDSIKIRSLLKFWIFTVHYCKKPPFYVHKNNYICHITNLVYLIMWMSKIIFFPSHICITV